LSLLTALPPASSVLADSLADSDVGKGSPIGLLVVLLLIVAVYFLYRSMNRHLRKVPPEFDPPDARTAELDRPPVSGQPTADEPAPEPRPDRSDDDTA